MSFMVQNLKYFIKNRKEEETAVGAAIAAW
jgi:hypothetical protein